jgi:RNA polymerase sigma factor (TIGR02999 family)
MIGASDDITRLLQDIESGRASAADELFPLIYEELRHRAGKLMAGERADHTLQPTALVHEAFLRVNLSRLSFENRLHFYNTVALAMRRILVNYAAARNAEKRGAGALAVSLDDIDVPQDSPEVDILALDEALRALELRSARQHQVVMLRYFAGMKDAEIAQVLDMSEKTVRRAWATAKLWLRAQMAQ